MHDDGTLPEIREQEVRLVIGHQTWWIVHGNVTNHPTPLSLLHCNNISIACHLKLVRHPYWVDYITNVSWYQKRHEY